VPQAVDVFAKAVHLDADDAQALHGLGLAKLASGKKDEAVDLLKQAYQKEEREDKKRLIRGALVRIGVVKS
jgi:Flp pilus assembly protein TadD